MNSKLQTIIRELSQADSKTLSQKVLKVCEEVGELAKVALPFENAAQTTHRFVDRQRILEEIADVYLTSISIAYELNFTDEEIEEMVQRKSLKWAELQQREEKMEGKKIPFEIHITVENANREEFIHHCKALDVKPIILALQTKEKFIRDVMTSSVHMGTNRSVLEEMTRITRGLSLYGYRVVREKIETVPWHPAAPSSKHANPVMPKNCYFEAHLNVITSEDRQDTLLDIATTYSAHLSRNTFKVLDDSTYTQMVTYRSYTGTYEDFLKRVAALYEALLGAKFEVEKWVTEFSIYDTKVSHDAEWLRR